MDLRCWSLGMKGPNESRPRTRRDMSPDFNYRLTRAARSQQAWAERLDRIAARMRADNRRVVAIRKTVSERRGHGAHYPKQNPVDGVQEVLF